MGCFIRRNLKDLGLVIQLGHSEGARCAAPRLGPKNFIVIHTSGIQPAVPIYCGCPAAPARWIQLLRFGLFPGSVEEPQTTVTLSCLRDFHVKNLQSGMSAYDYYGSLELLSDACSLLSIPVCTRLLVVICLSLNGWDRTAYLPSELQLGYGAISSY
jgi:hypothetical protein